MSPPLSRLRLLIVVAVFCAALMAMPSFASFTIYDTQTYDLVALGVPKFVNINYIELPKITQISKFRSSAGHDYSDSTQFGADAIKGMGVTEFCRSMKHYFIAPDETVKIYAPVSGIVSREFDELIGGTQLQITSDVQPGFTFIIFHVVLNTPLPEGTHIAAGQLLGHHTGSQTFSDIAVQVHTPRGYHHVSYFETLTDQAFAAFQARGVASRDTMIFTRAERDADPYTCAGQFTNLKVPPESEYVNLTGGAVTQTISASINTDGYPRVGDAAITVNATASSGLPVVVTSDRPKVCAVSGSTISWRRPGICTIHFDQAGDANTFRAGVQNTIHVSPPGPLDFSRPRLGGLYPPSATGPQSFLRFFNGGPAAGTVTVSLLNGDTGAVVAKWTSPPIPPNAAPQFSLDALETAAAPDFTRPGVYGLRVEPETAIDGSFQHVLYNPVAETLTNASSCSTSINGNPLSLVGVHTSLLSAKYPSSVIFTNARPAASGSGTYALLNLRDAVTGVYNGFGAVTQTDNTDAIKIYGAYSTTVDALAARAAAKPGPSSYQYVLEGLNYVPGFGQMQHLVTNKTSGAISDMTAECNLIGGAYQTVSSPLITSSVYSGAQAAAQSYLRVYNIGATAGPVTVTLHDPEYGASLGQWTSPSVPVGAERQYSVADIEAAIVGLVKKPTYVVTVDTAIDAYFQHVLWAAPSGALSNLSTCIGSTFTDQTQLMAVHTSAVGAAGYPSTIIVNNTGTEAAPATLGIYNAVDGAKLGTFTTDAIPPDAQVKLTIPVLEAGAPIAPGAATGGHYVIKLEGGFTGFLQHFVTNQVSGAITDMTLVCAL